MARIKISLRMKDNKEVRSIEELKEAFDLALLVGYYKDGKLLRWLEDRYCEDEAEELKNIPENASDKQVQASLCKIFEMPYTEEAEISEVDLEREERRKKLRQYTSDISIIENIDYVAFDQDDLSDLLDDNAEKIYLCNNKFRIPLSQKNKIYIGVGKVEIVVGKKLVDWDAANIRFENITFDKAYEEMRSKANDIVNLSSDSTEDDIVHMKEIAETGNVQAMIKLGKFYAENNGREEALKWLKRAGDKGDSDAWRLIGDYYLEMEGGEKDYAEAKKYYQMAADMGNANAIASIAYMYHYGMLTKDVSKAIELYEKAIAKNFTMAMWSLGLLYEEEFRDYKKAFDLFEQAADAGDIEGLCHLGVCYSRGRGVAQDGSKALECFNESYEKGFCRAALLIGDCFFEGIGTEKNEHVALNWYRKLADDGDADAMCRMGDVYCYGESLKKYAKALDWYNKANEKGSLEAKYCLGIMYIEGKGVVRELSKGVSYLKQAAEEGHTGAMLDLSVAYLNGEYGFNRNVYKAIKYFRMAAQHGNTTAMLAIGFRYVYGEGVKIDARRALEWMKLAKVMGDGEADARIEEVRALIKNGDIEVVA